MFENFKSRQAGLKAEQWRSFRQFMRKRKSELRMGAVFLVMIFLPSGLLGYLSWRAIENEKLLAAQKISESYRQIVRLAAREIDGELENVETRLQAAVEKALERLGTRLRAGQLDSLVTIEPLISSCALYTIPKRISSLTDSNSMRLELVAPHEQGEAIAREHDLYNELASRGEELEYQQNDVEGAIAVYRQILAEISSPQLRAMAYSLLGRAQTKKAEWEIALQTYQGLLHDYPEARDRNKMYLRFLAQYQIAVCLDSLHREQEAIETLLRMNSDLQQRSDTINMLQYSHFEEWIRALMPKLLAEVTVSTREDYQERFRTLTQQGKKRISEAYFKQLFADEFQELIVKRKSYRSSVRYFSGQADDEHFLLGYRQLPDRSGANISGLLGFRVNLTRLRERILPTLMRHLKASEAVVLAILDNNGNYVIGTSQPHSVPLATYTLDSPFEFWQASVFFDDAQPTSPPNDFSAALGLWLISLLLFSIFFGAYIFMRYARQEARLSELKSTFVSRVSHELRTPLTSIKMLAEHLGMQSRQPSSVTEQELRSRTQQYVSVISRESDRLGRLIDNILNFSKIERGVKQYNFEYELPAVVLQKAIDSFRPHAEAQGFVIKTSIDDSLPELFMDADGITQALLNLFSNAVKYSDKEKILAVRAFHDDKYVCIEVEDRGIGISARQSASIFDEFYRIDQKLNSKLQSGMGLGLTLVKHIVEAHQGTIKVHSEEGKGSTFVIILPIPLEDSVKTTSSSETTHQKNHQPTESFV